MTEELKSCPFCGRKANFFTLNFVKEKEYNAGCKICGIHTDNYKTMEEAANAWNKRCTNVREVQFYTFISQLANGLLDFDDAIDEAQKIIAEAQYD